MGNPYVSADHRDALIVMAGDGMDQLREERDRLKRELDAQTLHLSGYRQWLVDLDLADKVRAVYNRCFLGRNEMNVNDAAVLMEAVRFLHPHDETPAPHAGYGCGPKTPWDCLCGEPSCAYCGAQKTSEEPG